jgi:hypothetical protein
MYCVRDTPMRGTKVSSVATTMPAISLRCVEAVDCGDMSKWVPLEMIRLVSRTGFGTWTGLNQSRTRRKRCGRHENHKQRARAGRTAS